MLLRQNMCSINQESRNKKSDQITLRRRDVLRATGGMAASGAAIHTGVDAASAAESNEEVWEEQATIKTPEDEADEFDRFGASISAGDDHPLVGAPHIDTDKREGGAAYLFQPERALDSNGWPYSPFAIRDPRPDCT